jgi:hypothetical protein
MLYSREALEACRQVLNDVVYCLRDYEDRFYLIGGWAVYHLLDRPGRTPEANPHRGRSISCLIVTSDSGRFTTGLRVTAIFAEGSLLLPTITGLVRKEHGKLTTRILRLREVPTG